MIDIDEHVAHRTHRLPSPGTPFAQQGIDADKEVEMTGVHQAYLVLRQKSGDAIIGRCRDHVEGWSRNDRCRLTSALADLPSMRSRV